MARATDVRNGRMLVHLAPDAVAHEGLDDAVTKGFDVALDRVSDVSRPLASPGHGDAHVKAPLGLVKETLSCVVDLRLRP